MILNSYHHEMRPQLSPDGRFLMERLPGEDLVRYPR